MIRPRFNCLPASAEGQPPCADRLNALAKLPARPCDCEACRAGLPHVPMFLELAAVQLPIFPPPQTELNL